MNVSGSARQIDYWNPGDSARREPVTPTHSEEDVRTIQSVQSFAVLSYGLIFVAGGALLALAYVSETFRSMFTFGTSLSDVAFSASRLILVVVTLLWVLLWIANTAHELEIWAKYLDVAFVDLQARLAMLVLAIALAILILLTYNIVLLFASDTIHLLDPHKMTSHHKLRSNVRHQPRRA